MKTVVVTGASAGIGLAIAERFAAGGWQVVLVARGKSRLDEAVAMVGRRGPRAIGVAADVADDEAVEAAAERAMIEFGTIDAWVNNAMSTVVAKADEITPAEYAAVTASTYLSQVYGTLAALRRMRPAGRGAIVQVSSALAFRAAPLQAAYCAAKAAVGGFTDALRAELIAERSPITLGVVYLPAVNTPQPGWSRDRTGREQVIPDPLFDPRLCAEAVFAAVRDPQRETWVGRSTAMMAIGQSVAPAFSDRQAAGMMEKQMGAPMPPRTGNLEQPGPGPARIDGDATDRVIAGHREYFTSRQRDLLALGAAGGLLAAGAAVGLGLSRALPRRLR